jgi:hypothetical protein
LPNNGTAERQILSEKKLRTTVHSIKIPVPCLERWLGREEENKVGIKKAKVTLGSSRYSSVNR